MNIERVAVNHKGKAIFIMERRVTGTHAVWFVKRVLPIAPHTKRYRNYVDAFFFVPVTIREWHRRGAELSIRRALAVAEREREDAR